MKYTNNPPSIQVKEKSGHFRTVKRYSIAHLQPKTKAEAQKLAKSLRARGFRARLQHRRDGWWVFSNTSRMVL